MPRRLRVTEGGHEWVAEANGDEVRLQPVREAGDRNSQEERSFVVRPEEDDRLAVEDASGTRHVVAVFSFDVAWVSVDNQILEVHVSTSGRAVRSSARDHDALAPPMSATVVRIAVKPGDRVRQGDLLVALEAMKMELPIRAPRDGVVTAVRCSEGELVQPGVEVLTIE
jgi:acetyl-CoA/propionyl-CoA carboxylase biotin carboxyl carrier protein